MVVEYCGNFVLFHLLFVCLIRNPGEERDLGCFCLIDLVVGS